MFLSHQTIERYIGQGKIVIGPDFDKKNIRPVGIRLHLGNTILMAEPGQTVNLTEPGELTYQEIDISKEPFYLEPGQFVLGSTHETIQTAADLLAILDGRSTIARLGLTTHITASTIDGTFQAPHAATLEIKNVGNLRIMLKYKNPIAMMLFAQLTEPVIQKLQSQYQAMPHKVTPPNTVFKTGHDL